MTVKRMFLATTGLIAGLAVVAVILILDPRRRPAAEAEQFLLPAPLPAPDFTLTSHTGAPLHLRDATGDGLVVLFFGYTHCPDVCPLTLADLGRARGLLGEDSTRVKILLVTVDPARDTPAQLADYVRRFPPGIVGLTGSAAELEKVASGYLAFAQRAGVGVEPAMPSMGRDSGMSGMAGMGGMGATGGGAAAAADSAQAGAGDYLIDHTARSFVLKDRQVLMTFPPQTPAPDMAAGLRLLLRR